MPSTVIPSFRYHDAAAAIEWLGRAFGFVKQAVYANGDGSIAHAQLTREGGMIMLGSAQNGGPATPYLAHPQEVHGRNTVSVSVTVTDPDRVYETAQAAGAVITMPIADMPYGGRAFSCQDPEGYLWHFGSYNPWSAEEAG